jgi:N-acetyl-anhydromuramyl-L-alanine amidase AmpD
MLLKRKKIRSIKTLVAVVAAAAALTAIGLGSSSAYAIDADPGERWRSGEQPMTSQTVTPQTFQATNEETFEAECPPTLNCVVIPAAHQLNGDGTDPGNFGNYSIADRPNDMSIEAIVTHDTEGDLQSVLDWFQNPQAYVSAHYVIAPDGTVYQMVRTKDVAWQAGNWWYNSRSIGIEHVGFASQGHTSYTKEMYNSSGTLIKWLSEKFNISKDRQHALMGHDNIPAPTSSQIASMHVDPGPYWNWQKHAKYADSSVFSNIWPSNKFVTIAPSWQTNRQEVTGCWPTEDLCVPEGKSAANFVYLHTAPNKDAPLIANPVSGAGSTHIGNNVARVYYGQTFALAGTKVRSEGVWYKVWVNGTTGWLLSPWKAPTAFPSKQGQYVTAKTGQTSIPVYGQPLPELSEYPEDLNPPAGSVSTPTPLNGYTVNAGERYKIIGGPIQASHYYDWTFDHQLPYEGTNFTGESGYYLIQYGNQQYFVNAKDVEIES